MRILAAKKEESQMEADIEMEKEDAPGTPNPSPIPTYAPPPSRERTTDDDRNPTLQSQISREDHADLEGRVGELEETVRGETREIRKKIADLEHQTLVDSTDLVNLKWTTAELVEKERKRKKRGRGKRTNRKTEGRPRHRYNTRSKTIVPDDEVLQLLERNDDEAKKRVDRAEERIEHQEREMEGLREKLREVQALTPRLAELRTALDALRDGQRRINISTLGEALRLRKYLETGIDHQVRTNSRDIASLSTRFNVILNVASSMVNRQLAANAYVQNQRPTTSRGPTVPNFQSFPLQPGPFDFGTHAQFTPVNQTFASRKAVAM